MAGNEIDEIRAQRFAFVHAVCKAAGGDTQQSLNTEPIAEELGFDSRLVTTIASYLREEHLLEEPVLGLSPLCLCDHNQETKVTHWRDYLDPVTVFNAMGWPAQ